MAGTAHVIREPAPRPACASGKGHPCARGPPLPPSASAWRSLGRLVGNVLGVCHIAVLGTWARRQVDAVTARRIFQSDTALSSLIAVAHTPVRSAARPRVAPHAHLFRTCLRQAQRTACPAAAGRGDGRRRIDEARTRTHCHVLPRLRSCARASHRLRRSGKVQGPPKPETAAPSPLGVGHVQ